VHPVAYFETTIYIDHCQGLTLFESYLVPGLDRQSRSIALFWIV
jgi:hypothetical protein